MKKIIQDLIDCLLLIGLSQEETVSIIQVLNKIEAQKQLLEWMANQDEHITKQAVIKQVVSIAQK